MIIEDTLGRLLLTTIVMSDDRFSVGAGIGANQLKVVQNEFGKRSAAALILLGQNHQNITAARPPTRRTQQFDGR